MWLAFALLSALFAGATSILAKCGIKETDSNVATAIRTVVVVIFSWIMVFVVGSQDQISQISGRTLLFLVLSGFATGASWLCYFKALQLGNINKVVPIDKSSTVLTIVLAFIILGEPIDLAKGIGILGIGIGTYLMIQKKKLPDSIAGTDTLEEGKKKVWKGSWAIYAWLSAIFAALTAILGKLGIEGVESNLGTAIRTIVVLVMAWIVVFVRKTKNMKVPKKELIFIILSGFATGASWLCYYKALHDGQASIVVPIDKLSILVTIIFSRIVFKEKLTIKALIGLLLIVAGTLAMIF